MTQEVCNEYDKSYFQIKTHQFNFNFIKLVFQINYDNF